MTAQFHAMEARALARLGESRACQLALAATETSFAERDPGQDPEFISYFNPAELAAEFGHCFRDLGDAGRAAEHAAQAVASSDGQYQRSDFFAAMVLAEAYADLDKPEQACQTALCALNLGETLMSARCESYVAEFRQRLEHFGTIAVVRAFREQAETYRLWTQAA